MFKCVYTFYKDCVWERQKNIIKAVQHCVALPFLCKCFLKMCLIVFWHIANRRVKIEKYVGSARGFAMLFQRNSSFASTKLIIVAMEACVSFILR